MSATERGAYCQSLRSAQATINLIARLGRQQTLTLDATRWQTSDKDVARITRDAEELGGCVSA
ncbi:hypothetical protein Q9R35_00765 [Alcaligenes sp. AB3]|uniref:hypothetical protein n=1 Tax=Alcaligenes sp. AB3 TaxID=2962569 RepID=UPI00288212FD|nr:hypothetical protein [Alcaligenes sp. AB3]MDT0215842.1 hypothetical protein [Alcaligenes sp. AB3]